MAGVIMTMADVTTRTTDVYNHSDDVSDSLPTSYYGDVFTSVVSPIQLLIGLSGNAVCAYVTYRAIDVITPAAAYGTILAFVDSAVLLTDVSSQWLALAFHVELDLDVISRSDTACKTFYFLRHFLLHLASWTVVCTAVDAFRISRRPKLLNYFRSGRIVDTFVLLLVVLCTLNVHYFWTYGVSSVQFKIDPGRDGDNKPQCTFVAKNLHGYYKDESCRHVLEQLHWIVADILPVGAILTLLGLHLLLRRRRRRRARPDRCLVTTYDGRRELIERAYWLLLVAFVVFRVPYVVARQVGDRALPGLADSPAWALFLAAMKAWGYANFSCKVFLYASSWAFFRGQIRKMFRRRRDPVKRNGDVTTRATRQPNSAKLQITAI